MMYLVGSPFMLNVGGSPSGRVRETAVQHIQAANEVEKGQKCDFQLKIPGRYNKIILVLHLTSLNRIES